MSNCVTVLPDAEGALVLAPDEQLLQRLLLFQVELDDVFQDGAADLLEDPVAGLDRTQEEEQVAGAAVLRPLASAFPLRDGEISDDHLAVGDDDLLVGEVHRRGHVHHGLLALLQNRHLFDEDAKVLDDALVPVQHRLLLSLHQLRSGLVFGGGGVSVSGGGVSDGGFWGLTFLLSSIVQLVSFSIGDARPLIGGGFFTLGHFVDVLQDVVFGKRELLEELPTQDAPHFPALQVRQGVPHHVQAFVDFAAGLAVENQVCVFLRAERFVLPRSFAK